MTFLLPQIHQHSKFRSKCYFIKTCTLPRKASTCPAIPLMALRKMSGRAARQGCWQGSMTFSLVIANWRNFWVCETTAGLHRFAGLPRQCRNRNQLCAMQSLLIPTGISCASSSAVSQSILTSVPTLHQLGNTGNNKWMKILVEYWATTMGVLHNSWSLFS